MVSAGQIIVIPAPKFPAMLCLLVFASLPDSMLLVCHFSTALQKTNGTALHSIAVGEDGNSIHVLFLVLNPPIIVVKYRVFLASILIAGGEARSVEPKASASVRIRKTREFDGPTECTLNP